MIKPCSVVVLSEGNWGCKVREEIQRIHVMGGHVVVRILTPESWCSKPKDLPHLVFLHEALGCIQLWRDFPEALLDQVKLPGIVIERHGHGSADPFPLPRTSNYLHVEALEVLPVVLEKLGVDKAILIGHSDGGSIALIFASYFPEKVLGIVSEAAHVFVERETLAGIREAGEAYKVPPLREKLMRYHGHQTDAVFFAWQNTWLAEEFAAWNIEDLLPRIQAPVLAIQGEDDAYGTVAQIEAICGQGRGKREALILSNCGHEPHREARQQVLDAMTSFVESIKIKCLPTSAANPAGEQIS